MSGVRRMAKVIVPRKAMDSHEVMTNRSHESVECEGRETRKERKDLVANWSQTWL